MIPCKGLGRLRIIILLELLDGVKVVGEVGVAVVLFFRLPSLRVQNYNFLNVDLRPATFPGSRVADRTDDCGQHAFHDPTYVSMQCTAGGNISSWRMIKKFANIRVILFFCRILGAGFALNLVGFRSWTGRALYRAWLSGVDGGLGRAGQSGSG